MKELKAKTPNKAAVEFALNLIEYFTSIGDPDFCKTMIVREGSIIWEEGPYDWVMITGGDSIFAGESGDYSGKAEVATSNKHVFAECENSYSLTFCKQ